MRTEPTLRIPLGVLGLFAALLVYGGLIARYIAPLIADCCAVAWASKAKFAPLAMC